MRLLLAVILLLLPVQGALLEDAAGDITLEVYETTSADAPLGYEPADLRLLDIVETPSDILWTVGVESFDAQPGAHWDGGDLRSHFSYGQVRYMVQMGTDLAGQHYAFLNEKTTTDDFQFRVISALAFDVDNAAATLTATIPRDFILDEQGTPPIKGRSLSDIWVNSYSQTSLGGPSPDLKNSQDLLTIRDDMPDNRLAGGTAFAFQFGGTDSSGPVFLRSPDPFRASNGGEATITYILTAGNNGTIERGFDVTVEGAPSGWTVLVPNGTLRLGPEEMRAFPIVVKTPFGHQHGGSDRFEARMQDIDNPGTWATIELGIHYLDVPQPAGHHPRVWFHSRPSLTFTGPLLTVFGQADGTVAMNTLEEDPSDAMVPVQGATTGPAGTEFIWVVCLEPALRMGLDFDLNRTGTLDLQLQSDRPIDGTHVTGELVYVEGDPMAGCYTNQLDGRDLLPLANLDGDTKSVNSPTPFELTITPTPESDYVPYTRGAQLVLILRAEHAAVNAAGPVGLRLVPGASMALPLNEFFDETPAGLIGGEIAKNGTVEVGDFEPEQVAKKESPLPLMAVVAALAVALVRRR